MSHQMLLKTLKTFSGHFAFIKAKLVTMMSIQVVLLNKHVAP